MENLRYTCTLFPKRNATFLKLPFYEEECRSLNFRPNVISTMQLITIFCQLLPGLFFSVDMTQGHWPRSRMIRKILEIKIVFLLGKSVFPKNHRFVHSCCKPMNLWALKHLDHTVAKWLQWYNSSKMMGILHTFQTANSPKGQLLPPMGSWQVINWLKTVWKKKVHPKLASSSASLA